MYIYTCIYIYLTHIYITFFFCPLLFFAGVRALWLGRWYQYQHAGRALIRPSRSLHRALIEPSRPLARVAVAVSTCRSPSLRRY